MAAKVLIIAQSGLPKTEKTLKAQAVCDQSCKNCLKNYVCGEFDLFETLF